MIIAILLKNQDFCPIFWYNNFILTMRNKNETSTELGGVTNDALLRATNKGWEDWIALLDKAGGKTMLHKDISRYLYVNHLKNAWWCQMITVGYEQAKGLDKSETPEGLQVSVSKILPVSLTKLHEAFSETNTRRQWLDEKKLIITKSSQNKSIRMRWSDDDSRVTAEFIKKGDDKTQVNIVHSKLETKKQADTRKKYWKEKISKLESILK